MQWPILKILIIISSISLSTPNLLLAQISGFRLQQADSLFKANQYTQSLDHYKEIFKNKRYTPAMLLKMAFIEEGLNHTGEALYYLNLYYLTTKDAAALEKMEDLSAKYNLEGYTNTDADRALSLYGDYHTTISITLIVVIFFFLCLSLYLKRRKQRPIATVLVMGFFLITLAFHINANRSYSRGIIFQPYTYLMSGPSAGASVIDVLNPGHRVEITGQKDIWLRIQWNGQTAYIKQNSLLPVTL